MPTKADLQEEIDGLKHQVRRMDRALNQAQLDLSELAPRLVSWPTPHIDPRSAEAIQRGLSEWGQNISDPDPRVSAYIRTQEGIGWAWEKPYTRNGQFAWCGAFAAWCWTSVKLDIRKKIFPSCYRLYSNWSQSSRHIEHDQMAPGDIVVVYAAKRSKQGDHITICVEAPDADGVFKTVEGNAHGTLGDGSHGEGVIRRDRTLDEVAHVYRLLGGDFDE